MMKTSIDLHYMKNVTFRERDIKREQQIINKIIIDTYLLVVLDKERQRKRGTKKHQWDSISQLR